MHPVGDLLKQARTAKGLSLEQASLSTRIRKNYLEALERGDRDVLPSPVHARGFLRLYAGYLGLSPEDLVDAWEGRTRPEPPDQARITPPAHKPHPSPAPIPPVQADTYFHANGNQSLEPPASQDSTNGAQPEPDPTPAVGTALDQAENEWEQSTLADLPTPRPTSSQAILQEIGQTLRNQRERLGLTIDDVERYTHIRRRYLLALEAGRLDQMPSTVQSRGMLGNYSHFLNLDSEVVLLRFADALQIRRIEKLPAPTEITRTGTGKNRAGASIGSRPAGTIRRFLTPDLAFGAGLILILFVFVIWTVSRLSTSQVEENSAPLPSVIDMLLVTPSPGAPIELSPTMPPGSQTVSSLPVQPVPEQPSVTIDPNQPTATLGAINSDPLQVYIIARQRTFLRVTVDGQLLFNGRLVPGNAYPYSGAQQIDLLIGNAAAVQIFFNQQELVPLAGAGQSASVSFTQAGAVTPTPLPTATATATPPVTATSQVVTPEVTPSITPFIP